LGGRHPVLADYNLELSSVPVSKTQAETGPDFWNWVWNWNRMWDDEFLFSLIFILKITPFSTNN
jgi:hypothetical protein